MLMTLLASEAGSWTMGTTGVWTTPTNEQQEAA
jgi:hypothetical protein